MGTADLVNFKYTNSQASDKSETVDRLGETKSVQTPSASRPHELTFGARRCARFMMSNWCLSASDSAATVAKPPGLANFARVTS